MSTNKTQNYNLHSWVPDDDFLRAEMNENFTKLDTSLKAGLDALRAELGADLDALTALCGKLTEVTGSYAGNGASAGQEISLGFRPKAVLAISNEYQTVSSGGAPIILAVDGIINHRNIIITDTGFTARDAVNRTENYASESYPINPYRYIAWR